MKTVRSTIFNTTLMVLILTACSQPSGTGKDSLIEKQVEELLGKMTLPEKIGQMN